MAIAQLFKSELSQSKSVKSRPRPLSSSNSTRASAHSSVTYRASLGALLAMTVAFPATTAISYLLMVSSPTMISASPVMTLVADISTCMGPTGTGSRPPLLSVLPIARLKKRLDSVHDSVLISVLASERYTLVISKRGVRPSVMKSFLCDKIKIWVSWYSLWINTVNVGCNVVGYLAIKARNTSGYSFSLSPLAAWFRTNNCYSWTGIQTLRSATSSTRIACLVSYSLL